MIVLQPSTRYYFRLLSGEEFYRRQPAHLNTIVIARLYAERFMRQFVVKLGHIRSVIAITVFSWLTSVAITLFVVYWYARFGINLNIVSHLTIATFVPILLAPPISWYIIGLLLKIDQLEVEMRKTATFDLLTGLLK